MGEGKGIKEGAKTRKVTGDSFWIGHAATSVHTPSDKVSCMVKCNVTGAGTFLLPGGEEVNIC